MYAHADLFVPHFATATLILSGEVENAVVALSAYGQLGSMLRLPPHARLRHFSSCQVRPGTLC